MNVTEEPAWGGCVVKSRAAGGAGPGLKSAVQLCGPQQSCIRKKHCTQERPQHTGPQAPGLPDTRVGYFDTSVLCGSGLWEPLNSPRGKDVSLLLLLCHIRAEEQEPKRVPAPCLCSCGNGKSHPQPMSLSGGREGMVREPLPVEARLFLQPEPACSVLICFLL